MRWEAWWVETVAETVISATLPVPPSVNHQYRRGRGRVVLDDQVLLFRDIVALTLAPAPRPAPETLLAIEAQVVWARGDLDNVAKALLDALARALGVDDRQVVDLHLRRSGLRLGEEPHLRVAIAWPALPWHCAWCRENAGQDSSGICRYHMRVLTEQVAKGVGGDRGG